MYLCIYVLVSMYLSSYVSMYLCVYLCIYLFIYLLAKMIMGRLRKHEWFTCESDEDFPAGNRAALIGSSASQTLREQVQGVGKNEKHDLESLPTTMMMDDG